MNNLFGRAFVPAMLLATLGGCANLSPPDTVNPTTLARPGTVPPTGGYISWRLPKTVLDVTATFKFKKCNTDATGAISIDVERAVAITPRGIPDDDIYGAGVGDSTVRFPVSATTSFWQDRSLTVHHHGDGTLSQIGAVSEDQTAAILGNVLTSATKIASVALGVPPGAVGQQNPNVSCNTLVDDAKTEMKRLNGLLRTPTTSEAAATAYALQLTDLQKILDQRTITVTTTLDPGKTVPAGGLIGSILPTAEQLEEAKWLNGSGADQLAVLSDKLQLSVYLDFDHASPTIIARCPVPAPPPLSGCPRLPTLIDRNTQFREPAMIPILVRPTADSTAPAIDLTINGAKAAPPVAFAQFGIPRALPIKVGVFQKLSWTFNFDTLGEQQDVSFGSSASGVKATGLLAGATTGAATVANYERTADARTDPETARLQAEAASLKAQVDVATLRDQVATLRSQGKLPD